MRSTLPPTLDVALTVRARAMRNLTHSKFPNSASSPELIRVMRDVIEAATRVDPSLEVNTSLTLREREKLVGLHLISPNFKWSEPGRAVLVSHDRNLSIMVNEEDHLRVQVLAEGMQLEAVASRLRVYIDRLSQHLDFAQDKKYGYLAASVFNHGKGIRYSAMLHLVGLAYHERTPEILNALQASGISIRGLFGEGSRPVGAFTQVSTTTGDLESLQGACDYLVKAERAARAEMGSTILAAKAANATLFLRSSPKISLADGFRVLGWLRWATSEGVSELQTTVTAIDSAIARMDLLSQEADGPRADMLRKSLGI